MSTTVWVGQCSFQRKRGGVCEYGIAIGPNGDEIHAIVDTQYNKVVDEVYNFTLSPYEGCMWLTLPPPYVKGNLSTA